MRGAPTLKYFISETFGKNTPDPTDAVADADVHLETDLSYFEDVLENGDEDERRLLAGGFPTKINSKGREVSIPRHLAGIMESWHTKHAEILREHNLFNGLFINYAPRTQRFRNGPPFYAVDTESGLRIVTTFPGDMLAGIKDRIRRIVEIPNEENPLFSNYEQFRSRDAHRYLRKGSPYPTRDLSDGSASDVLSTQYFGNGVTGLPLKFVDIYGNMIFEGSPEVEQQILEIARQEQKAVTIIVTGKNGENPLEGEAAHSLTEGTDGSLLVYPNGNNIDVVRKWREGESSTFTTQNSSYKQFGSPEELHSGLIVRFAGGKSSEDLRGQMASTLATS